MITLTVGKQFVSQHKDWDLGCHRYRAFRSDQQCIVPGGTLEECMGSPVQLLPISGAGNFIYSGIHIRAHITLEAHLRLLMSSELRCSRSVTIPR
ncbi:hypothetical protein E2C01_023305 [Portunus trituberculatus]|uniref:Uncharacterized protein n=1 Tax=Portunus trituberculatus TaxID=210409 RepID=A0A5B7E7M8_PORTR|nr:hypothetical protein [Portunus trituberculatus]